MKVISKLVNRTFVFEHDFFIGFGCTLCHYICFTFSDCYSFFHKYVDMSVFTETKLYYVVLNVIWLLTLSHNRLFEPNSLFFNLNDWSVLLSIKFLILTYIILSTYNNYYNNVSSSIIYCCFSRGVHVSLNIFSSSCASVADAVDLLEDF